MAGWGKGGDELGQLDRPMHATFGPDGYLYVAEYLNDRIQVFTESGKAIRTLGASCTEPGTFDAPGGVAVASNGDVYVEASYATQTGYGWYAASLVSTFQQIRQARITFAAVERELDSEEPEGPPVVTIVSIETLHAFLGLPQEPEAAVDFIKTYGVFRPEDTQNDSRRPQFVRDFWHDTKRDGARPVVLKLYDFWYPQVRLTMVLDLYTALRSSRPADKKIAKQLADELNLFEPGSRSSL